jgi:crotonobetainyl-CoA:carnitine CoA-transferase CaiB-like acyl-CoA transferase
MLGGVRVLEISTPPTMLGGQILGDLGADVVTLEPPGGAAGRRLPPFVGGEPGLERSLTWHALNRNKRGITLDLAHPDGRALLRDLLPRFDVVISDARALDGVERPDDLVACFVSAFSERGPKSNYRWTDAVIVAAGGAPALAGEPDRAPLFFPVPQSMMETGAESAVAALAGLVARDRLGGGQDVAVQARVAAVLASLARTVSGRSGDKPFGRAEASPVGAMPVVPGIYECADGWVVITVAFAPPFVAMTQRMQQWLIDEGALTHESARINLQHAAEAAASGEADGRAIQALLDALVAVCQSKTKMQIVEIARVHRFMAAPALDMADIARFEHYERRGLFAPQAVGGQVILAPARFAQFSDFEITVRRPAPGLSAHTNEVLGEFAGLSGLELQALFAHGVI